DAAPRRLWRYPRDTATAHFLGYPEVVDARVRDGVAHSRLGAVAVHHPDGPVRLGLRADAVVAMPVQCGRAGGAAIDRGIADGGADGDRGRVRATVESVTVLPSRTLVTVDPVHAHGSATGDTVGG